MVTVSCKLCDIQFNAKPSWIKNGQGKYCSRVCAHTAHRTGKIVRCATCDKETYKRPKAFNGTKSGKLFCTKSCQTKWRNAEFKDEKHPNWKGGMHAYRRIMKSGNTPQMCTLCKTKDTRVLAVHHVDENRKNNTIENLQWLCHNCHHLVHHHPKEQAKFMAIIV